MRYIFILLIITFCNTILIGQNNISKNKITLGTYKLLDTISAETIIPVLIQGDTKQIERIILNAQEKVKYITGDIVSADISKSTIELLNAEQFVGKIDCPTGKITLLNDRMVINNNVDSAYFGFAPLTQGYDGTGIIIGVIDAPFDIHHGDFKNADGVSKIKYIWDQGLGGGPNPENFGYGVECDSVTIADGDCVINDNNELWYSHGSGVAGVAASSGLESNQYRGVAPNADLILVSFDFNGTFLSRIADAIEYVYEQAEILNKPCVINTSLGTYAGSHDGKDLLSQTINNLIAEQSGRSLVAAAGNLGNNAFHLGYDVNATEQFTWFKKLSYLNQVYFQLYADSAEFNDVEFSIAVDDPATFLSVGETVNYNLPNDFNLSDGDIESVDFDIPGGGEGTITAQLMDGVYFIDFEIVPVDPTHYWRFTTSGSGYFDMWNTESATGYSNYVTTGLPDAATLPEIINYKLPDTKQTIVSSWQCSENVITVGSYVNRDTMTNYYNENPPLIDTVGQIFISSSKGPTRDDRIKPDVAASGARILSTESQVLSDWLISLEAANYMSSDGKHYLFNGTSFASPIVAGIAALYLQKYPDAWYSDVKSAILSSANEDEFTGDALPDNTWGYGKVNAFRALIVPFVSLNENEKTEQIKVYPNPTSGTIQISGIEKNAIVELYNIFQERIFSAEINNSNGIIDISQLSDGIYLLSVNNGEKMFASKIILIK